MFKGDAWDVLQYILVDGDFSGAVLGSFKNGPFVLEDVRLNLPAAECAERREEILEAVYAVNDPTASSLKRYCRNPL